jgi:hypothetical protein
MFRKLLSPSPIIILFGILLSLDLFLAAFIYSIHNIWILGAAAAVLLYSLLAALLSILGYVKKTHKKVKDLADIRRSMGLSLCMSWILNILFSAAYLYVGITTRSIWFSSLGFFYIALSTARMVLLMEFKHDKPVLRSEYRKYMECGYALLFMMVSLLVVAAQIINNHQSASYPGPMLYAAALFSFYLMSSAIGGLRKYSRYRSPLLSACKMISIAAALLGIYSLQTAILGRYFTHKPDFIEQMNMATGTVIFIVMIILSVYMIIHGGKKLVEHQV